MELLKEDLDWCVRRLPKAVMVALKKNKNKVFVSGGFIRSCISNEEINDVDLFVNSKDEANKLANKLNVEPDRYKIHETDNAFTVLGHLHTIQIIHKWTFDCPESCIDSFDFTIAKSAIWSDGENWRSICDKRYYIDLAAKRLHYTCPERIEEAGGSLLRVLKFYQRGYRIPLESMGKVIARLVGGVGEIDCLDEDRLGNVLSSLLREVDPEIDPNHLLH